MLYKIKMNESVDIAVTRWQNNRQWLFRHDAGFTLLELLISITLLTVIIVLMIGAIRIGSRSLAAGEKKIEAQERLRSVISLIDAQIQSQIPLTYREEGKTKYYFQARTKTLRFATNYSIWGGKRGYVVVDYKIENDSSGKDILNVSEFVPGMEGQRNVRFLEASSISFEYFWKEPSEEHGKWAEALTEDATIPEQVRINLIQGTKKNSLLFPVRVGGSIINVQGGAPVEAGAAKSVQ